jgi:histidine kinase/DNA gyrase B/HSP90-like ATPase
VGVPKDRADEIFDAFFTTKPHGMGMGLPISRSIIESHGGRLWAAANSGPRASFQFVLPAEILDGQEARRPLGAPGPRGRRRDHGRCGFTAPPPQWRADRSLRLSQRAGLF